MPQPIIKIDNVFFQYQGNYVLEEVSAEVNQGDFVGVLGPNGSGKTTLLKIILGVLKPESGSVKIFGKDINHFKDFHKIGFVPQKASEIHIQFPLTVSEVIHMGRVGLKGVGKSYSNVDEQIIHQSLREVQMEKFIDKKITELSGGQQQRVLIAKALASEPELLILDEPTTGIDQESESSFFQLLQSLNRKGVTIVIVSHDTDTVLSKVNKVICLNKSICFHGAPHDFSHTKVFSELFGQHRKFVNHTH